MIAVDIPGFGELRLQHVVLAFDGVIAVEGHLIEGVAERLRRLSAMAQIHVLSSDLHGTADWELEGLPIWYATVPASNQANAKLDYVRQLGAGATAVVGYGRNDRLALRDAALGIALVQREGGAQAAIEAADLVMVSINATLDLLLDPRRLIGPLQT